MTSTEIISASKIRLGTTEATAMYIGSTLIWPILTSVTVPTPIGKKWVSLTSNEITSSTPIYKIAVIENHNTSDICRIGFSTYSGLNVDTSEPYMDYPARIWYDGLYTNQCLIYYEHQLSIYDRPSYLSGWMPYSSLHTKQSIICNGTIIRDVWVHDCLTGTYSEQGYTDMEGGVPLYFFFSQTNSPLDHFYVLIDGNPLPAGYTKLEYISSTNGGNQYIDLGIKLYDTLNKDYDIAIKFMISSTNAQSLATIFNCQDPNNNPWPGTYIRKMGSGTNITGRYIGGTNKDNTIGQLDLIIELPVQTSPNKNVTNLNNNNSTHQYGTSLFCSFSNTSNAPQRYCNGRLYYFILFVNGTLVRELIPCKNSNNVVGMYDIVNNTFYTSPNGASFVAGPEI